VVRAAAKQRNPRIAAETLRSAGGVAVLGNVFVVPEGLRRTSGGPFNHKATAPSPLAARLLGGALDDAVGHQLESRALSPGEAWQPLLGDLDELERPLSRLVQRPRGRNAIADRGGVAGRTDGAWLHRRQFRVAGTGDYQGEGHRAVEQVGPARFA